MRKLVFVAILVALSAPVVAGEVSGTVREAGVQVESPYVALPTVPEKPPYAIYRPQIQALLDARADLDDVTRDLLMGKVETFFFNYAVATLKNTPGLKPVETAVVDDLYPQLKALGITDAELPTFGTLVSGWVNAEIGTRNRGR